MTPTVTTTKPPTTSVASLAAQLEAAKRAALRAEDELLRAGEAMLAFAATAVKLGRQDRRCRVSVESHVDHLLAQGGPADLAALERALSERPQLFTATLGRALARIESEVAEGYWRNGTPDSEATLLRAMAEWDGDTAEQVARELARVGANAFHLAALGYQRVHRRRPELFGRKTRVEDAEELARATQTIADVLAALRATPPLLVALAAEYGVRLRPDADGAQDVLDAAVAAR
jgi:hypothetical protein